MVDASERKTRTSRPRYVRDLFWMFLDKWRRRGATVWADCGWPVEARFLMDCMKDDPTREGPYPLYEIAALIRLMGGDPTGNFGRLDNELPIHDPLADARQSARLLIAVLTDIQKAASR